MWHKELLYKALDHIHSKPKMFFIGNWVGTPDGVRDPYDLMLNPTCDTTLCLAGWVIHETQAPMDEDVGYSGMALKALGVDGDEELSEAFIEVFYSSPEDVETPEDLVAALVDVGILTKGEYTCVG